MKTKGTNTRTIKRHLFDVLNNTNWKNRLNELDQYPPQKLISPLFSTLCASNETIRWHGITCFGSIVSSLAELKMESARIVMRRLLWSLNDESGGIGWGAPEAMGEIMASHLGLAKEYSNILLSFILQKDGASNFLELTPLRKGAYWGIARLAQSYPHLITLSEDTLISSLYSETDPYCLAYLTLILKQLDLYIPKLCPQLQKLIHDKQMLAIYWNTEFNKISISQLAQDAYNRLCKKKRTSLSESYS